MLRFVALLALAPNLASAAGDAEKGQKIYMANCLACHGAKADGQGPAAAALKPKPTDFTAPAFWKDRTDQSIKVVIKSGKPGTAMMAFGRLSEQELDDVVAFLRSQAPAGQ